MSKEKIELEREVKEIRKDLDTLIKKNRFSY